MTDDNGGHSDRVDDQVDAILDQWARQRPDVDVSGMAAIGRLTRVHAAVRRRLGEVFAQHDLESWEFDVLATLLRTGAPHRLTPGELLESTMVTSGAMTNRIDRLERRGYVRRLPDPDDGRRVLVCLTDAGTAVVDAALVDHATNERDILSCFDDQQERTFVELLRVLHDALVQDRAGPA